MPHAAKGGAVQVAVVRDESQDATPHVVDAPLAQAQELNVIVLEPDFLLSQRDTLDATVIVQQLADPVAACGGTAAVRWVAEDHQDRRITLGLCVDPSKSAREVFDQMSSALGQVVEAAYQV